MNIILKNYMDLNKKNFHILLSLIVLGMIIGTLGWEIIERLAASWGGKLSLTIEKPIGFDLYVISFFLRINMGSLIGALSGVILFKVL
jgi:uncharacterized membrane-anchored protein YjiN (DUF445 family)